MSSVAIPCGMTLPPPSARSRRGAAHSFAARADDRLDELMVGVFVTAVHQLEERVPPVGSIIVAAAEIKRANWIVARMHGEDAHDFGGCQAHRVTDGRDFGGLQVVAQSGAAVQPPRRKRMRGRREVARRYH